MVMFSATASPRGDSEASSLFSAFPIEISRDALNRAAVGLGAAVTLTLLEAFGFREDEFLARFGFWTLMIVAWLILSGIVRMGVELTPARKLAPGRRTALVLAIGVVVMAVISQRVSHGAFGWTGPFEAVERMFHVTLVMGTFELIHHVVWTNAQHRAIDDAGQAAPPSPQPTQIVTPALAALPPLARRLPFALQGPILCLEMEDHYVRVHTTRGSSLLLMRLSDAVAELAPSSGLQVHRSWWIATEALAELEKSSRSMRAHLTNGVIVPVSRPYVRAVQDLALGRNLAQATPPAPDRPN